MLLFICAIVFSQAYLISWIIPVYDSLISKTALMNVSNTIGYAYLTGLVLFLIVFYLLVKMTNKKKIGKTKEVRVIIS
jgi:uncharacterized membrane protein